LRVGYAPSLASQKHPTVRWELFDLSAKGMITGLENDTLDLAPALGVDREPE